MKKLLLALLVSGPFIAGAQSFTLTDSVITNEDGLYKATVKVHNVSGTSKDVMVTRTIETQAVGHQTYFCWGSCYGPSTNTSPDFRTIAAGGVDTNGFYGDLLPNGVYGVTRVNYCFYDKKNTSDQACYTVTYDVTATGIKTISVSSSESMSAVSPNPVQSLGNVSYDLSGRRYTEANLVVRNLTGAVVRTYKITQTSGDVQINADQMNSGIYMYSLVVDGKAILTKKMIVTN